MVYGETGRYPVEIDTYEIKNVKFLDEISQ